MPQTMTPDDRARALQSEAFRNPAAVLEGLALEIIAEFETRQATAIEERGIRLPEPGSVAVARSIISGRDAARRALILGTPGDTARAMKEDLRIVAHQIGALQTAVAENADGRARRLADARFYLAAAETRHHTLNPRPCPVERYGAEGPHCAREGCDQGLIRGVNSDYCSADCEEAAGE